MKSQLSQDISLLTISNLPYIICLNKDTIISVGNFILLEKKIKMDDLVDYFAQIQKPETQSINVNEAFETFFKGIAAGSAPFQYEYFRSAIGVAFEEKILFDIPNELYVEWYERIYRSDFLYPTKPKSKKRSKYDIKIQYDTYLLCQITTFIASKDNSFPTNIKFTYESYWKPEYLTLLYVASILDPKSKLFTDGYISLPKSKEEGRLAGINELTTFYVKESFLSNNCYRKYRLFQANVMLSKGVYGQIFLHDDVYFLYIDYTKCNKYSRKIIKVLPKEFPDGARLLDAVYVLHPRPYAPISIPDTNNPENN